MSLVSHTLTLVVISSIYLLSSKASQSYKFLWIIIDEKLKWQEHINAGATKVSKSLGVIYKMKNSLPVSLLPMLYSTLILPCYQHWNIVWACNYPSNLQFSKRELYVLLVQLSIWLMQLIYLKDTDNWHL